MTEEFENFNDRDEEWLRELELRATTLENDLFDWREAHARELTDSSYSRDEDTAASQRRAARDVARPTQAEPRPGRPVRSMTIRTRRRPMPSRMTSPMTS